MVTVSISWLAQVVVSGIDWNYLAIVDGASSMEDRRSICHFGIWYSAWTPHKLNILLPVLCDSSWDKQTLGCTSFLQHLSHCHSEMTHDLGHSNSRNLAWGCLNGARIFLIRFARHMWFSCFLPCFYFHFYHLQYVFKVLFISCDTSQLMIRDRSWGILYHKVWNLPQETWNTSPVIPLCRIVASDLWCSGMMSLVQGV